MFYCAQHRREVGSGLIPEIFALVSEYGGYNEEFSSKWLTRGSNGNSTIRIACPGYFDCRVDWGDGSPEEHFSSKKTRTRAKETNKLTHTYARDLGVVTLGTKPQESY